MVTVSEENRKFVEDVDRLVMNEGITKNTAIKRIGRYSVPRYYIIKKAMRNGAPASAKKRKPFKVLDLVNLGHGGIELEQVKPQKQMMMIVGTQEELLQFAKGLQ